MLTGRDHTARGPSTFSRENQSGPLRGTVRGAPVVNQNRATGGTIVGDGVRRMFRQRTSLPSSVADVRKSAVRSRIGVSDSNTSATFPIGGVSMWESTDYHDIIEGDLMMVARRGHANNIMTAISLRSYNDWSRTRFNAAYKLVKEALDVGVGLSCGITDAQLREMMSLPTETWKTLKYLSDLVRAGNEEAILVNELSIDSWLDTWNCYGVALGQQGQSPRMLATTVAREGVVEEVANVWGKTATQQKKLFLVLKREKDGPYYWHPVSGYDIPTPDQLNYVDVTGHRRVAPCLHIGQVIWWNNGSNSEFNFEVDAGLVPKPGPAYKRSAADFKIYLGAPRGSRHATCF